MSEPGGTAPGFTADGVEFVGYHDVGGKPVFKLAIKLDERLTLQLLLVHAERDVVEALCIEPRAGQI